MTKKELLKGINYSEYFTWEDGEALWATYNNYKQLGYKQLKAILVNKYSHIAEDEARREAANKKMIEDRKGDDFDKTQTFENKADNKALYFGGAVAILVVLLFCLFFLMVDK